MNVADYKFRQQVKQVKHILRVIGLTLLLVGAFVWSAMQAPLWK